MAYKSGVILTINHLITWMIKFQVGGGCGTILLFDVSLTLQNGGNASMIQAVTVAPVLFIRWLHLSIGMRWAYPVNWDFPQGEFLMSTVVY